MFFYLSQIVFFCIAPSHICLLLLATGAVLQFVARTQRLARRLIVASLIGFIVLGFSPLGAWLILPLEDRFPRPATLPSDGSLKGIIMLGGFEDGQISNARNSLSLNNRAERLTETLLLARRLPDARVIFTGGAASLLFDAEDAGTAIGRYLNEMGIAPDRIVIEAKSRNTWENATLTRDLIKPRPGDRFLLVTSAWHMPRSVGVFRQAGYDVIAWPVDYETAGTVDLGRPLSFLAHGLATVDIATKQWIGLVAYRLTGRSDALFPGPRG